MDLGIVNPTLLEVYDDIPTDLLEHVEDVLLDRHLPRSDQCPLLFAETVQQKSNDKSTGGGF